MNNAYSFNNVTAKNKDGSIIVVEQDNLIGPDLRWPLRISKLRDGDITLLVHAPKNVSEGRTHVDLSALAEQPAYEKSIADRTLTVLD